ncbi:RrF2 family transcriptional regulator [Mesoterricola sediminis]|uniref:Rrf2 family transcriptional regulator n=1 Tax=Mesoterricola sediminis TaxID=2927980 RepID=A0AA48H4M0_9BACT|nr:Rrf2 family transcriptional regulator [Mesoterricola sediminis]BDU77356.1 Rrf2 family transcriptional regulator [Mesoterricola sediminis]
MPIFSLSVFYAFRTLGHLRGPGEGWVRVEILSERTAAPGPFLAKVLQALQKAGVVDSLRGRNGGFRLRVAPTGLPLAAIVDALDGTGWRHACLLGVGTCTGRAGCPAEACCRDLRDKLVAELERLTVADLGPILAAAPLQEAAVQMGA